MKKLFSVFCLLIGVCSILFSIMFMVGFSKAKVSASVVQDKKQTSDIDLAVGVKACYLTDIDGKVVMFSRNEHEKYPIASMCKIMTLLLTFESIDGGQFALNDKITVSENASGMGGSQAFLDANTDYVVSDLIKTVVVASANDSSVALAEKISGSEEAFIIKMNARSKELGMNDTVFANCTGLPTTESQHSSAYDVAIMLRELLKHKDYKQFTKIWLDDFKHPSGRVTTLTNTNKLIRFYNGCDSGKTGYTDQAGHCIAASAERDNLRLVSVVIGGTDSKTRFACASRSFNYGFANYKSKPVVSRGDMCGQVKVKKAKQKSIDTISADSFFSVTKNGEEPCEYEKIIDIHKKIAAPLKKGDKIGVMKIQKNGIVVKEIDIVASCDVEKQTYFDIVKDILQRFKIINKVA